jgi:putative ABC transport system permease protein
MVPYGVTRDDYRVILETIETVDEALKIREIPRTFRYRDRAVEAGRLVGCTPEYAEVTQLHVARGHFLSDPEMDKLENVCVLAAEVADELFPVDDPLGKKIQVEDDVFKVVGVLHSRQPTAAIGGSFAAQRFDRDVYIPITTLETRIGDFVILDMSPGSFKAEVVELSQITVRVNDVNNVVATAEAIEDLLDQRHELADFDLTVPLELLEQARTTRMMFIIFLGLIAAISLVVGGIGIMNIMLATVTERTREIGIRRALGAKRRDITMQFLAETVVLSIVGGVIGVGAGLLCGPVLEGLRDLLTEFMPERIASLPEVVQTMEPIVVPWSIPLAFGISVGVGVIFGLYPAIRAARMDPVEALRHE